jgi:hypothetical protein
LTADGLATGSSEAALPSPPLRRGDRNWLFGGSIQHRGTGRLPDPLVRGVCLSSQGGSALWRF